MIGTNNVAAIVNIIVSMMCMIVALMLRLVVTSGASDLRIIL